MDKDESYRFIKENDEHMLYNEKPPALHRWRLSGLFD
jgi:hypothetical protein